MTAPARSWVVDAALLNIAAARDVAAGVADLDGPLGDLERVLREHADQPEAEQVAAVLVGASS